MKKMIMFVAAILFAGSLLNAQQVIVTRVKLLDGRNLVQVAGNNGTIELTRDGDKFSNVIYTDVNGKVLTFSPKKPGSEGLPAPCKWPIPDACFGIPNASQYGMCMCRPGDIKGGYSIDISLILPAVQRAPDLAAKKH